MGNSQCACLPFLGKQVNDDGLKELKESLPDGGSVGPPSSTGAEQDPSEDTVDQEGVKYGPDYVPRKRGSVRDRAAAAVAAVIPTRVRSRSGNSESDSPKSPQRPSTPGRSSVRQRASAVISAVGNRVRNKSDPDSSDNSPTAKGDADSPQTPRSASRSRRAAAAATSTVRSSVRAVVTTLSPKGKSQGALLNGQG